MKKRWPYRPERGTIYANHGGGAFKCTGNAYMDWSGYAATMRNVKSGWTFTAKGIHEYEDGTIDWDYSVGGRFQ